jgi:hypothetical protein
VKGDRQFDWNAQQGRGSGSSGQVPVVRIAAIAGTVALLAVSAPVVWRAVSAGIGLAVVTALALGGAVILQLLPYALQRLENRILRLRKVEARARPIEQLQNDCLRREQRLHSFRQALATLGSQIESMTEMVEERRHLDPGHLLARQQRALQRMVHFHACNLRRLDEAQSTLEAFRHKVEQKVFEWQFAQAGQAAIAALNESELDDLTQDLLTDEALRGVQDRFNAVFAELDMEMRAIDAPTRGLLAEPGVQLDALALPGATTMRRSR